MLRAWEFAKSANYVYEDTAPCEFERRKHHEFAKLLLQTWILHAMCLDATQKLNDLNLAEISHLSSLLAPRGLNPLANEFQPRIS